MAISQNGWPALLPGSSKLVRWNLSDGTKLYGRNGCAGFVLMHLAERFDDKVQDIDGGVLDDWMYAYRAVRGYYVLSNHASGTAIDLNATRHPLGKKGTFTTPQVMQIDRVLLKYHGAIRWGGHYSGRLDAMHFELNQPIAQVNKLAIDLMDTPMGKLILKNNPDQKRVILS